MLNAHMLDVIDDFNLLEDWEQRYRYLVELGEQLPPMPPALKIPAHQVKECMSTVHVYAEYDPQTPEQLRFYGDCDTAIIKGVVALLVHICNGKTPLDVEQLDIDNFFAGLKLDEHLSPSRHVGVYAIVNKMQQQARQLMRPK